MGHWDKDTQTKANGEFAIRLSEHLANVRTGAGIVGGISDEQIAAHDVSKLSEEEFDHYARQYCGDRGNPSGYARAWLHHIHNNPHHWQYWMFSDGYMPKGSDVVDGMVPMPEKYLREMVADWLGASLTYTKSADMTKWLTENLPKIKLHPDTLSRLLVVLGEIGYAVNIVKGRAIVRIVKDVYEKAVG